MDNQIRIDELKFDEKELIPAVVIEAGTHKLLMVAWMNRESLEKSVKTGLACFWSRSRQKLWTKGETSGHFQHIVSITADCDSDTLQIIVKKDGPACHTGSSRTARSIRKRAPTLRICSKRVPTKFAKK